MVSSRYVGNIVTSKSEPVHALRIPSSILHLVVRAARPADGECRRSQRGGQHGIVFPYRQRGIAPRTILLLPARQRVRQGFCPVNFLALDFQGLHPRGLQRLGDGLAIVVVQGRAG